MAATGKTPILLYGSTTATNQPSAGNLTNSSDGCEIAINVADKNLFFKDATNTVNTVPIRQSGTSSNGWLSSTDWNTFNNKQPAGTYVTSVTGTAPVVSSGGTTPAISMAAANGSTNGYLTSTDWTTFNNKQAAGSYAVTNAGQTFTGVQKFTDAIVGGSSNVNFEILGANAYSAIGVGPGISRACKIAPVSDSGYVGWQFSSLDTFTNSSQLPSDASLIADILKINALNNNVEVQAGNLVIGTSGKGIDFSATAGTGTSELLADYEEGTWTPVLNNFVGTASVVSGTYTKIGRLVYIYAIIVPTTTIATTVASSYVSGLPYNPAVDGHIVNWATAYTGQLPSIIVSAHPYAPTIAATSAAFYLTATYTV